MQFTTFITAAILAMGSNAAIVRRQDPNLVQFSGWRESECSGNASAGVYIISESQVDTCKQFSPPAVGLGQARSVSVEAFNAPGCTLTVYSDNGCYGDSQDIREESCVTVGEGLDYFLSYKVTC
ncbi:hypothetical protein M426DRAFT_262507 [Hypoxylon sp. CI-4A]|nr:hypothetical protein M426DRAFT_262507 [Hypoxylon sp. CI-4A]